MAPAIARGVTMVRSAVKAAAKPAMRHSAPWLSKGQFLASDPLVNSSVRLAYIDQKSGSAKGHTVPESFKQVMTKLQELASCKPPNENLLNDLLTLAQKYEATERGNARAERRANTEADNQFSTVNSPYPNYVSAQLSGSATD